MLDDTVFSSLDRRRLLAASGEIEDRAMRVGRGTLAVGLQRLSGMESQLSIYPDLGGLGSLDVHVFGAADWKPSEMPGLQVHATDDPDIAERWFLAYDGGGDPDQQAALLAHELDTDNAYDGFWTYESDIVARIDDYVTATYLDAAPGGHAD